MAKQVILDTLELAEQAAPTTPGTGRAGLYLGTDKKLYLKDSTGSVTDLTLGGGATSYFELDANGAIEPTSSSGTWIFEGDLVMADVIVADAYFEADANGDLQPTA